MIVYSIRNLVGCRRESSSGRFGLPPSPWAGVAVPPPLKSGTFFAKILFIEETLFFWGCGFFLHQKFHLFFQFPLPPPPS